MLKLLVRKCEKFNKKQIILKDYKYACSMEKEY